MDPDCAQSLNDHAPRGVHTIGADGRHVGMSPARLTLVGAASEKAIRDRRDLGPMSPRDTERVRHLMAAAFADRAAEIERAAKGSPPSGSSPPALSGSPTPEAR